jgi:hypothetical protein
MNLYIIYIYTALQEMAVLQIYGIYKAPSPMRYMENRGKTPHMRVCIIWTVDTFKPQLLYPRQKSPGSHWTETWVGPGQSGSFWERKICSRSRKR